MVPEGGGSCVTASYHQDKIWKISHLSDQQRHRYHCENEQSNYQRLSQQRTLLCFHVSSISFGPNSAFDCTAHIRNSV
jgi:hypothetical protein